MILIADSGSTKTDWCVVGTDSQVLELNTEGINPIHQNREVIKEIINQTLCPQLPETEISAVYFYGSGCTPQAKIVVEDVLKAVFSNATIEVESDLLGAARALLGKTEGIACILGTGSNSCLYDGEKIIQNTPALGYILGDEGSGAVIGKRFVNALFKHRLSPELELEFTETTGLSMSDIINKVYREPMPNRFLASLVTFIKEHLAEKSIQDMLIDGFREFLQNNILPYKRQELPLNAIGGIAYQFRRELALAAYEEDYTIGKIEKSPMAGLIRYHGR